MRIAGYKFILLMRIQFIKNIHFTRLLKINGRLREFNFRKIKDPQFELFSVDVCDERGNRIMFKMQKENNLWRVTSQPLPEWILDNEDNLSEMIEDELRKEDLQ
jgi:hypothetical protein